MLRLRLKNEYIGRLYDQNNVSLDGFKALNFLLHTTQLRNKDG